MEFMNPIVDGNWSKGGKYNNQILVKSYTVIHNCSYKIVNWRLTFFLNDFII